MVLTIISKNDQVKLPFTDQRFSDALVNPDTLRVSSIMIKPCFIIGIAN